METRTPQSAKSATPTVAKPGAGRIVRRRFLGGLGLAGGLAIGVPSLRQLFTGQASAEALQPAVPAASQAGHADHSDHGGVASGLAVGDVDPKVNGFDPMAMLTDFDYGKVSKLPNGQTLREYTLTASVKTIQIAAGVNFEAWTYNERVPGPTIRATEGDRLRITFINATDHPHSIHFHGIHAATMDGMAAVAPGDTFVYEFDAAPFGLHLYHCHIAPLTTHIMRGLHGMFIIDPKTPRPQAHELMMVMNAFDLNNDGENEIYAVNTVGFHFFKHPIPLKKDELVRVYLVNITEFDPINSFHLHANLFHQYRTGTSLVPDEYTDLVMLCQGQRAILEFRYDTPGLYMFHAHQTEFTDKGWVGHFEVK